MATASRTAHATNNEVTILARFLTNGNRPLPKHIARYLLTLTISEQDKARMHDLVVRNQKDSLSPAEKKEMHDFGVAGDPRKTQGARSAFHLCCDRCCS